MQSCAFMNGQHQQAGPLPQPSQAAPNLTHNMMRNQLSRTANNASLGVQPSQSASFALQNGIYSNGQTSYWQPSTGPHQAVSSEQKSKKKVNSPLIEMLLTSPSTDRQLTSQNYFWPTSHGLQTAAQHNFHQNSATQSQPNKMTAAQHNFHQNSATQSQPSKMTANTTYNHTNTSSHWKQNALVNEGHSSRIQDGQVVSHLQQSNVPNGYHQNANTNPGSVYSTAPTSLAREHLSASATAHNRQTAQAAHNQIQRQNNPQLGFSPSTPQAGHIMSPCQPRGNNSTPTHSSSRTQMLYAAQGSSACNNGGNSTISSNANSFNQYGTKHYLTKANEPALNLVVHQQKLRQNVSADSSQLSYTTNHNRPPSHRKMPYKWHTFAYDAKMTKMQPVPSAVSESCNLSNSQSLSLHSGQSFPESSQSFMSGSGQLVNEPPQQNSASNIFSAATAGDNSLYSNADVAHLCNNNTASKGNPVGSLSSASQLTQLPKDISPQGNKTQSSVVNNPEQHERMSQNDSSIHSSPGLCSTRAIAVVQPLSAESCQNTITFSNARTNESSWSPDKVLVSPNVAKSRNCENLMRESNLFADHPNQLQSNKSDTSCSAASNDGALLSKSDSGPQNLTQESALDISIAKPTKKTTKNSIHQKVPVSQNCSEDQGEIVKSLTAPVLELSSLPTGQWTAHALTALIKEIEKVQTKTEDFTEDKFVRTILHLFWEGSSQTVMSELRKGCYRIVIRDVREFLDTELKSDTVILSAVKRKFLQQLKNYHLLSHDEVYSELPYKSSWLNLNEQLDDIDEEFGFPVTLVNPPQLESDNQMDQLEPVNSIPEPAVSELPDKVLLPTEPVNSIPEPVVSEVLDKVSFPTEPVNSILEPVVSEVSDKVLLPTELEPVDSGKEKPASSVNAPSTQTPFSNEAESCDPWYSFNIQVMPPEEAKHLFEQVQTETSQSKGTDCQAEKVISSCVASKTSKGTDSAWSVLEKDACDPIEHFCCIARLVEISTGESTSSSKCQCRKQSNDDKCTDKTSDKDKEEMPTDDSLFEYNYCRIFDLITEEENPEDTEDTHDQITICSSELCDDVIEIIDLTDDKDKYDSTRDPGNIFEIRNGSRSSFLSITDNKYKDLPNSENKIPIQMPKLTIDRSEPKEYEDLPNSENEIPIEMPKLTTELSEPKEYEDLPNSENEIPIEMPKLIIELSEPEDKCEQEQLKSTETMQSSVSVCDDRQTKSTESGNGKQISDNEEGCAQPQLKSADVAESFLETKGQTQTSATADLQRFTSHYPEHGTAGRKRKRLSSHDTFFPFHKKSKKWKLSVDLDSEHAFDSISKCQKNLVDAAEAQPLSSNAKTAELVLFGSARPDKSAMTGARKNQVLRSKGASCETQKPPERLSVNLSPLKSKSNIALHAREQSAKERIYEKWRRCFEPTKIRHRNKLKRQKCSYASIPKLIIRRNNPEMRVWKAKKPKQHDGHGGKNTKNESNKIRPLHENSILKFSVLPNTFDFKHGSEKRKESTGPASDRPDHAKEENQHSNRIILKIKGPWYPSPEKKYKPLCPSAVPKTSSLFDEFKKKYIKKTSSTDE